LVTSVREGWGLVVTEAASVGTPSYGYDVPGLRDSILVSGGVSTACSPRALGAAVVRDQNLLIDGVLRASPAGVLPWESVATKILVIAGACRV